MKVKATRQGYYGNQRRYEGDVFVLEARKGKKKDRHGKLSDIEVTAEKQFSSQWMEKVEEDAPVAKAPRAKQKREAEAADKSSLDAMVSSSSEEVI